MSAVCQPGDTPLQEFIPGQRWVSGAEPGLGLGTVVGVEHRTVTLVFPATGETRTYARQGAPLARVRFSPGDTVSDGDDVRLTVESADEHDGLLVYHVRDAQGRARHIGEQALNAAMQLNRPGERLFSHQFDAGRLFELRYHTWQHAHELSQSTLYGLTGCRTSLIPHQLYIAHEVAGRHAPRVLLADEVGLGKTIEAGLILHQQLLTERAHRVLVVVPESLLHQWLVEMLRRFNLMFSVFDAERCQAVQDNAPDDNPFHSQQLVLCSLEFLTASPLQAQALAGEWDLLVVDEAHRLHWSEAHASREYRLVEALAARTPGVLLLTATPEQLGRAGHFARLRLLDPHRFTDLETFIREEQGYEPVARAVEHLLGDLPLDPERQRALAGVLDDSDTATLLQHLQTQPRDGELHRSARRTLVERLLDRHGTGRVLFRNTRAAVQGFPSRLRHEAPLPLPPAYEACLAAARDAPVSRLAAPERLYAEQGRTSAWTDIDPRVSWLATTLQTLRPDKVLVIAAHAQTVTELAEALYSRHGVHAALFHEGLSLVERDRAAAFFADRDIGTQVMVCSEIGSEGRNFQFARHLVLFDLPFDPDLLEQRIGRLDRIGQTGDVHIHVPYLRDTAQAVLYRWYREALAAFEHTCPAGAQVFARLETQLLAACREPRQPTDTLIEQGRRINDELNLAMQSGRDRLLEYNSCRQPAADRLCEQARSMENPQALYAYTETLLDAFGVELRPHSEGCLSARPGDHMLHPLPGLPDDDLVYTCERDVALAFEDTHYLSWEHPLLRTAMDMLLTSELGNCTVCALRYPRVRPGTLLLECLYILESGHRELARNYHLAPVLIRVVVDEQAQIHDATLPPRWASDQSTTLDNRTAQQVVQARDAVLRRLLHTCESEANARAPALLDSARGQMRHNLQTEIDRLRALSRVNPAVREEESAFFERQLALLDEVLRSVSPRLDAVRVMVAV